MFGASPESHQGGLTIIAVTFCSTGYKLAIGTLIACIVNCHAALAQTPSAGTAVNLQNMFVSGELTAFNIDVAGINREALIYISKDLPDASDRAEQSAPVVFAFHGYGNRAEDFARWVDLRRLANRAGFVLIYPQGLPIEGVTESFHWNPVPQAKGNKSTSDDLGFVDALLGALDVPLKLDPSRTYAVGYSNGGMFAYALACFRSSRFAAIAVHAGTLLEATARSCEPPERTAIAAFHGTADPVVRISGGVGRFSLDQIIDHWTRQQGLVEHVPDERRGGRLATRIFRPADAGRGGMVVHKVWGGRHVWQRFNYQGQDADDWLWSYFIANSR